MALEQNVLRDHHHSVSSLPSESAESHPSSASSISFMWGPGALAGSFLKWVGDTSLDALVRLVIRKRLVAIKRIVRERPHMFTDEKPQNVHAEVLRIHGQLGELCSGNYPLGIQQRAARLVLEIAHLTHSREVTTLDDLSKALSAMVTPANPWNRWGALLKIGNMPSSLLRRTGDDHNDITEPLDTGLSTMATATTGYTFKTAVSTISLDPGYYKYRMMKIGDFAFAGRRLTLIKQIIRKRPHIFVNDLSLQLINEVDDIYYDLGAFINRVDYPSHIRRRAVRLVLEIVVIISGPSVVLSLQQSLEDDLSARLWAGLVTRGDVQSLLNPSGAAPLPLRVQYIQSIG